MDHFSETLDMDPYRSAVLSAIVRNREPGFSFTGNLVNVSYEEVGAQQSILACAAAPHVLNDAGNVDFSAIAVLADISLGSCPRVVLDKRMRLATVSMTIVMHRRPGAGDLYAQATLGSIDERTGLANSLVQMRSGDLPLCTVTGTLLALPAPTGLPDLKPRAGATEASPANLSADNLSDLERSILERVSRSGGVGAASFLERFWGFEIRAIRGSASGNLVVGPQVGNRIGQVQGGVFFAFAAAVSRSAARPGFRLTSMHATFQRPGASNVLQASALSAHQGRTTEVVNTSVADHSGAIALFAQSTFVRD